MKKLAAFGIAAVIGIVLVLVRDHQDADRAHRAVARIGALCASVVAPQELDRLEHALDDLSPRLARSVTDCAFDATECDVALTCMASTLSR